MPLSGLKCVNCEAVSISSTTCLCQSVPRLHRSACCIASPTDAAVCRRCRSVPGQRRPAGALPPVHLAERPLAVLRAHQQGHGRLRGGDADGLGRPRGHRRRPGPGRRLRRLDGRSVPTARRTAGSRDPAGRRGAAPVGPASGWLLTVQ